MRNDHAFKSGMWTTMAGIAVLGLGLSAALAAPAAGVVGDWQGTLDTGSGSLRVVLHFSQLKDETFAGTLDSPDQGATGIAIDKVTFRQPDLHFEIARMGCSYDGKISKDNLEIAGQWKQGGGALQLSLKRVP
ncbi:MAG: hypothetical protein ABSF12_05500 [Bryobacteraceae bacterium]